MRTELSPSRMRLSLRCAIALAAIFACLLVIWLSGRWALARIFSEYALAAGNVAAADEAVRIGPSDAESHFVRAEVFKLSGAREQAVAELENAASLRPRDYFLWLQLGLTRDEIGDQTAALSAFNEAVRLAPYYAQPRWQRGNLLLRIGRYEEAFADLRLAAASNPNLLPNVIDLAWGISQHDSRITEQLAANSDEMRRRFALFLAEQGKGAQALEQFRSVRTASESWRQRLVQQLVEIHAFEEAFSIWNDVPRNRGESRLSQIYDGGFEGPSISDKGAFGWRITPYLSGVNMSLDPINPHSGAKSLHIEFGGNSNAETPVLSQLIVVSPSSHYRVNFAVRAEDVVTGGLPLVVLTDATSKKRLGRSTPLAPTTTNWQGFSFEFASEPDTTAVVLSVQREGCSTSPCPMFGSIWLDSFSLEQLK